MRKIHIIFAVIFLFLSTTCFSQTTSWKGTTSTAWATSANWTSGVPTATVNAIIGDANFTGTNKPTISTSSTCKSLTVGGTVAVTLTVSSTLTVSGNVTINSNGTISHGNATFSLTGNWSNSGAYSGTSTNSAITFNGTSQTISGSIATSFRRITVNAGSTVTLQQNISVANRLTVSGIFSPNNSPTYQVSGAGTTILNSGGTLKVYAATFAANYATTGTVTVNAGSTVEYGSSSVTQTIANYTYSTLIISGSGTKQLASSLSSLRSTASTYGNIYVNAGNTLDLLTFTANRGTTVAGGTFSVASGATLRIGGTVGFPSNYASISLGTTSTVEYYGNNQTVLSTTYGNLNFSGTSGAVTKTLQSTAFTVAGNFSSALGAATSLTYTAASNISFLGNVTIGSGTTFSGASFYHTIAGNFTNNGTFTGSTSTIEITAASKTISGTGTFNFNNLAISGSGVTATSGINVAGNLTTTGTGSFTHSAGTLTLSGVSKTITGTGILLNDVTVTGSPSTTSAITIAGNLTINTGGSFTSSGGSITMSGTSKTITSSGTLTLYNLTVSGSITTASSFTISSSLTVSGSITASAGTATFTGAGMLTGTANLYNVTLNGTSLQLAANAVLGIANIYTVTAGTLDVTTSIPNTVNFNGTTSKTIPSGTYHNLIFTGNTNTAGGAITVNGNLTINASTTFAASSYTHTIKGDFINNGTFTAGTGTIQFTGRADGNISGASTFNIITINKSASTNSVNLQSNISVATINMTQGGVSTGSNTLTITTTRTGTGIILGNIQRTHAFITGVAYEFESSYNTITFTAVSGVTSILVNVTKGTVSDFPFNGAINRQYTITVPTGTYTANLRLHYEDAELNGNSESGLTLWQYSGAWTNKNKNTNSTTSNYVDQTGLTNIATRWTCSDDNNVVSWNGSVSSNWATAANWTAVQGSPSLPPSSSDAVQIGFTSYINAPVISTAATAKSISLGSIATTVSLNSGGSLTTGNISGTWSSNATHTINANGQTITVNGDVSLSDGTSGHVINLNISTGTVTVAGILTESGGANISFSGNGVLNIGNDFNYVSGSFSKGTGTVMYNGTIAQSVAAVNYNNLTINKTGIATISNATTVSGNLGIAAGELDITAAATVSGNVSISSGAILNGGTVTTAVAGNWSNSGTFVPSSSTILFNGSSGQTISASPFNNLTINNAAGVTLLGNLTISGSVFVSGGILSLSTFTANRSTAGGSFSISNGATLNVGGANNFPANYTTYSLGNTSTVAYNGTIAQAVLGISYGNLVFSNGTTNAKTLAGNATVNGDITINSGATFSASSYTINLSGNWTNNGTFTASTSTVNCNGTTKTITGNTTFNTAIFGGSYTVNGSDVAFNGAVTIALGGSLNTGNGTTTVNADFINNGTFTSSGTVTFSGTAVQNIKFINAVTTFNTANFNGTVAPVLSSTSSPTFNTVNINNAAGVATNVGWNVNTAFNISAGAGFNGGNVTHNIYGSFTNNGAASSSGTLNFAPGSSQTIKLAGTNFTSTGTVIFDGTGAITVTGTPNTLTDVAINNTTGVSPSANWTIGNDFNIGNNAIFNAGSNSYAVGGDIQSSGTLNGGTSNFTMSSSSGSITVSANTTFYDFTITGDISALSDYHVLHNFTNNGSYDGSSGTLIMTGSAASTIGGTATTYNLEQLDIQKSAGVTTTLAHNITGVIELDITTGILDASTRTITQDAGGGALILFSNGTLKIGGTNTLPSFNTYSIDSLSTVEYNGTTQTITSLSSTGQQYGNLVISTAGTKTANGILNIRNNFTLTNASFVAGSYTDTLGGNWSMSSGVFTNTGNTFVLDGTGAQTLSSTGAFNNFTVNKTAGTTTLSGNITLNGTLNFIKGTISTAAYTLITTGTISGAAQSTGWVDGALRKNIATGATAKTYEVGDANYYAPAAITFASVTVAGTLDIRATSGNHPNLTSAVLTKNIPLYWTLGNTGVSFTSFTISLSWNAAENYSPIDAALLKIAKYTASAWTFPSLTGTSTTTNVQANGITTMGDFAVGENCNISAGFTYNASPYCSNSGTAGITLINGGTAGAFTAVPSGLSLNGSTGNVTLATSTAGTYTVTNTATGSGGCIASSFTTIVVTAAPSATINYTGTPFCNNASTGSVTLTGTTGGAFSSTTGLTLNTTSGNVTPSTSTAGSYTVTYTVAAANGCSQYSTTAPVTITAIPSATISYAGNPFCTSGGSVAVTLTGTTGGSFSSTSGLSINSTTGTITTATSTPGTYTVTYTVAGGGCSTFTTTTSVTINLAGTWTGAINTNWNNAGNWLCGGVPTSSTNVLIPGSLTNYPVVSSATAKANNVTIQSGASVTVNGAALQIAGTISNSGTLISTNGTIEMNGSSVQTIPANMFSTNTLQNLTINNSAGVTLNGTLKLTDVLKVTTGNFNTGGYLTLLSSSSKTALIDGTGNGNVTGNVTMQQYLTSGFGYKYVSSPFQSATVNEFSNDLDLNASFPTFYYYDENLTSSGWANYTATTGLLNPLQGYAGNFGTSSSPKTIDMTGTVNNGSVSSPMLYNHNRTYTLGFNLVGNPYPSPIDWNATSGWTKTNIDDAIYYFNASTTDQYTGTYSSYINGISSDGVANNIIPAMQGFFVHLSNGSYPVSGQLTINNNARVNNFTGHFHFGAGTEAHALIRVRAVLDNGGSDAAVIYFDDKSSKGYNTKLDALKLFNTDTNVPNLFAVSNNHDALSIRAIIYPDDSTKVPLTLKTEKDDWVSFSASDMENMPAAMHIYFYDAQTDSLYDLKHKITNRSYLKAGKYENRFYVVFSMKELNSTSSSNNNNNSAEKFYVYNSNGKVFVNCSFPQGEKRSLVIVNMLGQIVYRKEVSSGTYQVDQRFTAGVYIVSLVSKQQRQSQKIFIPNN